MVSTDREWLTGCPRSGRPNLACLIPLRTLTGRKSHKFRSHLPTLRSEADGLVRGKKQR
jgi:hypothetical protein